MRHKVFMWHGYSVTMYDDLIKLVGCETPHCDEPEYHNRACLCFTGSLDDFFARWKHPMMVYPDGTIHVTYHNNFGQR